MKSAIIIGITGQDGAYLAQLLLQKGYSVTGITRDILELNTKNLSYLKIAGAVEILELPVPDKDRIIKILKKTKPTEVYNLAAQSSVGYSFVDPFNTLNYNILSVLSWLECIKLFDASIKFYQASSSEMFGNVRETDLPLKESLIFRPASPYGVSKAAAHWLVVNYRESNQMFCCCGILFNHESPLRGANYVVKKIINTAVKIKMGISEGPLTLGNLQVKRDWGYAPDYVNAMWLIMQYKEAADFLVCSGNVWSLQQLLNYVFEYLQLDIHRYVQHDDSLLRPKDLEIIYGDNFKARDLLGWNYDLTNEGLIAKLVEEELKFIEWELQTA
ncbi:MAG: GDP-mannose 4,6-dehydratase [Panacibacter sp.]